MINEIFFFLKKKIEIHIFHHQLVNNYKYY